MSDIRELEPKELWNYFHEITRIPHPSKKEAKIVEFMKEFGHRNNLETIVDKVGNVIIRKPATKGMENRKGVILQTNLDMVPQKNSDKKHDFEKDPIETVIDGDWVKANGTTLGSDNGIGVSAAMTVLTSKNIPHGPLEALFTVDEETGMTGANGLKKGLLKGEILLNLDSEDENEICVGCAGGIDVSATKDYDEEKTPKGHTAYRITASGLKGGHSGVDIAMGRANSNKLMFRFMMQAESDFGIRISEPELTRHDLYIADEAFLTGTAAEVIPMIKVDGRPIGDGKPGPITSRTIARFRELTRESGTPIFSE